MNKCLRILVVILLTVLLAFLLLLRGLVSGILVSIGQWSSWQWMFVCLIIVLFLLGLLIAVKKRRRIALWLLLAVAAVAVGTAINYTKPFSFEQHRVCCSEDVCLIVTRSAFVKGYDYQVYRQHGFLAKDAQLEISTQGRFSSDDYTVDVENGCVNFLESGVEDYVVCSVDFDDLAKISVKEAVLFFFNECTVIYIVLLVRLLLWGKITHLWSKRSRT